MAMEWSVQQVDGFCSQLDRLADQLSSSANSPAGLQPRDEQLVNEVIQAIQRVGEGIAWAYGQRNRANLGELFAQPFVDHRTRDRLKQLLDPPAHQPQPGQQAQLQQRFRNRIATQILQTIHILLQATPEESTLFCNLTAGWYLNGVVAAPFEFRENEDLLPLWITVVKEIASMLTKDNMMLFFDPTSNRPFPIYSEAVRFYHHPTAQVRTGTQALSLEIFLKLRDKDTWTDPIFQVVCSESMSFFTHLCCLLRDFWFMVDGNMRSGSRRDARSALSIQSDITIFANDVLSCDIPTLSSILQEKLLRFAIFPILVRSAFRGLPSIGDNSGGSSCALMPSSAIYMLCDALLTLKGTAIVSAVALALLQQRIPDEVLQLVLGGPPRTPTAYLEAAKQWGGNSTGMASKIETGSPIPDESLYAMPPLELVSLLEGKYGAHSFVSNKLLDLFEAELRACGDPKISGDADATSRSVGLLEALCLMLKSLRGVRDMLASSSVDRLGTALCNILIGYQRLPWPVVEAALSALHELAATAPAAVRPVLAAPVRDKVLRPVAKEVFREAGNFSTGGQQELWLWEFQEQWKAHLRIPQEPDVEAQKKAFLEIGQGTHQPAAGPEGRARALHLLLTAQRLMQKLGDSPPRGSSRSADAAGDIEVPVIEMPGIDEIEQEETSRYQPGVAVHIGKMNRVKCQVRFASAGTASLDWLYLLPTQSTLVLVRPDEQKPFWAVPVISEPLRSIRLDLGDENSGPPPPGANGDEAKRSFNLQVIASRSPALKKAAAQFARGTSVGGASPGDRLAMTAMTPAGGYPGQAGKGDPLAHSAPVPMPNISLWSGGAASTDETRTPISMSMVFADDRRRRVACKLLAQAQHGVHQRATKSISSFLTKVNAS